MKDWNLDHHCQQLQEPPYPEVFDVIIVGAGPAGMTAAIYAARRRVKTLLVCGDIGGQMRWSPDIQNWTGVAQATGKQLVEQFFEHVKKIDDDNQHFDLWVAHKDKVNALTSEGEAFLVHTESKKSLKTKSIILSPGKTPRILNVPGEDIARKGNGLSFASTFDYLLYEGKSMVVVGGGNSSMEVALQLAKNNPSVTILTDIDTLIGETCLIEEIQAHKAIDVRYDVKVEEVVLDEQKKVSGIRFQEGSQGAQTLECQGIFVGIGQVPSTGFLEGFLELNEHGEIPIDRDGHTSVPGVFAAGDATDQRQKQVIVAAGSGAIAALEACKYGRG